MEKNSWSQMILALNIVFYNVNYDVWIYLSVQLSSYMSDIYI